DRFMMTQINSGQTPYGGSDPYDKIEKYPAMARLWDGYAFAIFHNEDRGHFYSQIDQAESGRVQPPFNQPGACANCHAGEAPQLIADMGWAGFNSTPYNDMRDEMHTGSTCADCHDPQTMELRLTRPGLINALDQQGIDWTEASRKDMRTYVCAQCHVEYYFAGDDKLLTFPWAEGLRVEDMETYYNDIEFRDWTHAETGAPMIKIQHPEYELYTTSLHYESGVSCADCHMPFIREGGTKISDHWIRSPLTDINSSCQTCHNQAEAELTNRVLTIQNNTAELLRLSEDALLDAMDVIVLAQAAGATDEELTEARDLHRSAQLRWDFISSENSTGFHSPQESSRILAGSIDMARRAQLNASELLAELEGGTPTSYTP
ncbi:MAG: ammonia-forming cytochrome c nitrite reductase subunit c552, partial [Chloroflexota bacterium]